MRFGFSEVLSGGVSPSGRPDLTQPFRVALDVSGRGLRECALGAPLAVGGELCADEAKAPGQALVPARGCVTGTLRFLVGSGLFYDLRLAETDGAPPREQLALRGARRFVRADLFTSATTFDGVLERGGEAIGVVRLRFDARDDVPRLIRSLRFQR